MAEERFSLKDHLFNPKKIEYLAGLLVKAYPQFDAEGFSQDVLIEFPHLELKQRIAHITQMFQRYLPSDYLKALDVLLRALPPELDPTKTDDDFGDFIFSPHADFVARYGCDSEYFEVSINALKEMTKRFSAEDAIRYFINAFPSKMREVMMELAQSSNYHQRRLASEGSRLLLPWCQRIVWSAQDILPILDQLYSDKTRYVTRSVANSLNDLSKIESSLVFEALERWEKSAQQVHKEIQFIKKHALRTLLKKGNEQAMTLFGFTDPSHVELADLVVAPSVKMGATLPFSFQLNTKDNALGRLRVEYTIHFMKANGKHGDKRFKLKEFDSDDPILNISKSHSFKAMTTRRHYEGRHQLGIIVNGKELGRLDFEVIF